MVGGTSAGAEILAYRLGLEAYRPPLCVVEPSQFPPLRPPPPEPSPGPRVFTAELPVRWEAP